MTGQIPKYGQHFRLESTPWHPDLANRIYVLRADPDWFIRSDKTSGTWRVYWHFTEHLVTPVGTPLPTFGLAMLRLLDGIERGFYATRTPGSGEHQRLETLRASLRAGNISYGELAELQSLTAFIDPGDTELLEAAGVPEFPKEDPAYD